jgi:hypothetical protein
MAWRFWKLQRKRSLEDFFYYDPWDKESRSRYSIMTMGSGLNDSGLESRQWQYVFFFFPKRRDTRPSVGIGISSQVLKRQEFVMLTAHHQLMPRLRMSGAILLPLYAFVAWRGTTLPPKQNDARRALGGAATCSWTPWPFIRSDVVTRSNPVSVRQYYWVVKR